MSGQAVIFYDHLIYSFKSLSAPISKNGWEKMGNGLQNNEIHISPCNRGSGSRDGGKNK